MQLSGEVTDAEILALTDLRDESVAATIARRWRESFESHFGARVGTAQLVIEGAVACAVMVTGGSRLWSSEPMVRFAFGMDWQMLCLSKLSGYNNAFEKIVRTSDRGDMHRVTMSHRHKCMDTYVPEASARPEEFTDQVRYRRIQMQVAMMTGRLYDSTHTELMLSEYTRFRFRPATEQLHMFSMSTDPMQFTAASLHRMRAHAITALYRTLYMDPHISNVPVDQRLRVVRELYTSIDTAGAVLAVNRQWARQTLDGCAMAATPPSLQLFPKMHSKRKANAWSLHGCTGLSPYNLTLHVSQLCGKASPMVLRDGPPGASMWVPFSVHGMSILNGPWPWQNADCVWQAARVELRASAQAPGQWLYVNMDEYLRSGGPVGVTVEAILQCIREVLQVTRFTQFPIELGHIVNYRWVDGKLRMLAGCNVGVAMFDLGREMRSLVQSVKTMGLDRSLSEAIRTNRLDTPWGWVYAYPEAQTRNPIGLAGFNNLGTSCFFNSVLQAMMCVTDIVDCVVKDDMHDELALGEAARCTWAGTRRVSQFKGGDLEYYHGTMGSVADVIVSILSHLQQRFGVHAFPRSRMYGARVCQTCGTAVPGSFVDDTFGMVPVNVPLQDTEFEWLPVLRQSLHAHYSRGTELRCTSKVCNNQLRTFRTDGLRLDRLPRAIVLNNGAWSADPYADHATPYRPGPSDYDLPRTVDMYKLVEGMHSPISTDGYCRLKYKLRCYVVGNGGHYWAYVTRYGRWFEMNDSTVREVADIRTQGSGCKWSLAMYVQKACGPVPDWSVENAFLGSKRFLRKPQRQTP